MNSLHFISKQIVPILPRKEGLEVSWYAASVHHEPHILLIHSQLTEGLEQQEQQYSCGTSFLTDFISIIINMEDLERAAGPLRKK